MPKLTPSGGKKRYRDCPKELTIKTSIGPYIKQQMKLQGINLDTALKDAVADVMHVCRQKGLDWDNLLAWAEETADNDLQEKIWSMDPRMIPTLIPLPDLDQAEKDMLLTELKEAQADGHLPKDLPEDKDDR